MYSQNSISIYQLELEAIRQRVSSDNNFTSAVMELSAVLDRKKLLQESWNSNAINALKAERDEWKHKAESLSSEASHTQNELQAQILKFQNECTRLEVEWKTARNVSAPLEAENNELRTQCRELGDDLIACQKVISDNQMNQLTETVALNESSLLRKQLSEALETAEYWQNCYEKSILTRSESAAVEDQSTVNQVYMSRNISKFSALIRITLFFPPMLTNVVNV
jgi:predicted nuclease of restriction endonuclease-like RecB superfamily